MPVAVGARLGPYELQSLIGAGGMGEVYRARDTRLDRTVAIKLLPAGLHADSDRHARFEREARTIAGLTHPHICTLYDVGTMPSADGAPGPLFLVMEHLWGETLAARLRRGPLRIEEALEIGAQIAEALDAAHKHGIIHRDLKPANVMLTTGSTGRAGALSARLLDFGLAKLRPADPGADAAQSASTRPAPLTGDAAVLGTLPYMAPEQLEGGETDARTDLWALGAMLHEMVTGSRPFEGDSTSSLIGHILHTDPPPLTTRQPLAPPALERLVRTCLAKRPDDRWDSAHDLADELRWIAQSGGISTPTTPTPRRRGVRTGIAAAGALVAALTGAATMWWLQAPSGETPLARLSLDVRPADELNAGGVYAGFLPTPGGSRTALTWTPDGQALVFVGRRDGVQQLYVRRLDAMEARPLTGTAGAQVPAVSPDGLWVAFWADGTIGKVPLAGGPVATVMSGLVKPPWGLVWTFNGGLLLGGEGEPIREVSADGAVRAVTTIARTEYSHGQPWLLPDGGTLLFSARKRQWAWGDEQVIAQTLATGARKVLLRDAADARFLPTGHLVFLRRGVMFAVRFDAERIMTRGAEVALLDTVAQGLVAANTGDLTGAGQFAVSESGTLAWVSGPVPSFPDRVLVTMDRRGRVSPLPAPPRSYGNSIRVSPDGRSLAISVDSLTEKGLWVYDLGRGVLAPLLREGDANWPHWWPDGRRLAFSWQKEGRETIAIQQADGTTPPEVIVSDIGVPSSIRSDGKQVAAIEWLDGADVRIVTLGEGEPRVARWMETPQTERSPEFSPDGRWLAYGSDASGRSEVYVRPYPGPGAARQVSLDGGTSPAWNPAGRELFFVDFDSSTLLRMMAVDVDFGPPLRLGTPKVLFEVDPREFPLGCRPVRCFDVAPDGKRFYVTRLLAPPPPPVVTHVNLVQNWFKELRAKVPVD